MPSGPSWLRFLCPCPLPFLPRVLRNRRTRRASLRRPGRVAAAGKKMIKERKKTNKRTFRFSWCPAALRVGDQAMPVYLPLFASLSYCRWEHKLAGSQV